MATVQGLQGIREAYTFDDVLLTADEHARGLHPWLGAEDVLAPWLGDRAA